MAANALRRVTRARWVLTREAFERLLAVLDADPERAAVAYEELRHRLIGLLQWWGASECDELADRTLDRVARKLEEGAVIPAGSLGAYVRGVARMVFHETAREIRPLQGLDVDAPAPSMDQTEAAHRCLDRCLAALPANDRDLTLRYYGSGNKEELRRTLAAELGISATALRIRTHRLRQRLETCVAHCLGKKP